MKTHIRSLVSLAKLLLVDEQGGEVMEWVLIGGLIVVGVIATVGSFGTKVLAKWTSVNASM